MLLAILTYSHFQKMKRSLLSSLRHGGVIDQDTFQKFLLIWINWCGRGLAWKIGGAQKIVHAASFPGRTLILVGLVGIRARGILGTPYPEVSARLEQLSGNGSGQFGPNLASALSRLQAHHLVHRWSHCCCCLDQPRRCVVQNSCQGEGEILLQ